MQRSKMVGMYLNYTASEVLKWVRQEKSLPSLMPGASLIRPATGDTPKKIAYS
jgi:hypothetical protein